MSESNEPQVAVEAPPVEAPAAEPVAAKSAKGGKAAAAKAPKAEADGLVEAEVKRGTVYTDDGPVGPGGTVRLPAEVVARMRGDGLLVDPDNGPLAAFDGPQVSQA